MTVINIPASLKKHTNNQQKLTLKATNLGVLLTSLVLEFPDLDVYIFTKEKKLCSFMGIAINDKLTRDLSASLIDGDEVSLIPAVAGG